MAMFDDSNDERTETATPYRREEFRRQGSVALSREVLSVVIMGAVALTIYLGAKGMLQQFNGLSERYFRFAIPGEFGKMQLLEMRFGVLKSFALMAFPTLMVAMITGMIVSVLQVGLYLSFEPLNFKWDKINPINGLGRIFSPQGLVEAAKSLLKIAIASWVVWRFLKGQTNTAAMLYQKTTMEITIITLMSVGRLFMSLLLFLSVIALMDYGFQKFNLEKQMKMTRRETKEEFKLREGDPLIRSRMKSIHFRIASKRMMEAIPKATVIVTNPTHLAIALQYDGTTHAPKVTAKGAGFIAEKIKEIARANHIPIVENKPLARNMFKTIKIGQFIPKELYKAVAEVLSYIYKLKGLNRPPA